MTIERDSPLYKALDRKVPAHYRDRFWEQVAQSIANDPTAGGWRSTDIDSAFWWSGHGVRPPEQDVVRHSFSKDAHEYWYHWDRYFAGNAECPIKGKVSDYEFPIGPKKPLKPVLIPLI